KDITLVGVLPKEICTPTTILGFISTKASDPPGVKALLEYLASPEAQAIFKDAGFQPHSWSHSRPRRGGEFAGHAACPTISTSFSRGAFFGELLLVCRLQVRDLRLVRSEIGETR